MAILDGALFLCDFRRIFDLQVEYSDDGHSGFNAVVTKSGHAVHPAAVPAKYGAPSESYAGYHR